MKFALASDVHLEFAPIELKNTEGADVLILSGDICVAKDLNDRADPAILGMTNKSNMYHDFFQNCSREFKNVIYIAGNHEHYHGDFAKTHERLTSKLDYLGNLHILEKEYVTFNDVTFIAGTLWTDMNNEDPETLYAVKGYMNDYRVIMDSSEPVHFRDQDGNFRTRDSHFSPERSVREHKAMLKVIDEVTKHMGSEKFVVVGHHAPSKLSTKPKYANDFMVNGAYSSDLSEFILDRPMIKAWTHGHTHDNYDYMVGSTRIVCNPRGYDGYEGIADSFKLRYFDV
jgi:predicted phosphodiesterase